MTSTRGGRPSKYRPDTVAAIIAAVETGATYRHAAASVGVSERTLHDWQVRHPQFSQALKTAEASACMAAIGTIRRAAEAGTWQAAAWYLERRYPAEYGRRAVTVDASVQVTHDDGLSSRRDPVAMFLAALTSAEAMSALPSSDDPVTITVDQDGDRHGW
jgi:hypothetical protein